MASDSLSFELVRRIVCPIYSVFAVARRPPASVARNSVVALVQSIFGWISIEFVLLATF